jgi:hypothetical protein
MSLCLLSGDFDFIFDDLLRMATLLADNGSKAITWGDLKYYIKRFITPKNVLTLVGGYLKFRNVSSNAIDYRDNVFLNDIKNQGCKMSISLFFDALGQPTSNFWALRMFDATGKPPTNLLAANTNWMGNWNSCHKVTYSNSSLKFKGRYCRAKIRADPALLALAGSAIDGFPGNPDELAAVDLGICVPDLCNSEDIAILVNNSLKLMTIHQVAFIGSEGVSCEGPAHPGATYYFTVVLITILTLIVVLATLYDCFYRAILNKPYATTIRLKMQNMRTFCNFSSDNGPQQIYSEYIGGYQYQFSSRLQLHGMTYESEEKRATTQANRKRWYSQWIYRIHRIIIDLSAYTAILKPMSNTGK